MILPSAFYTITTLRGIETTTELIFQDTDASKTWELRTCSKYPVDKYIQATSGADPEFFLGGGALVSCSTSTPINHLVFFLQNTSCIRKPPVISRGGGAHPLHPPPSSAPAHLL